MQKLNGLRDNRYTQFVGIRTTTIGPFTGDVKAAALCPTENKSVNAGNTVFLKYDEALAS
jgi:hypothetical protein